MRRGPTPALLATGLASAFGLPRTRRSIAKAGRSPSARAEGSEAILNRMELGLPLAARTFVLFLGVAVVEGAQESEREESPFRYGGEVAANFAPVDPGYFNHTDYGDDSLRLFRLNLALEVRPSEKLSLLADIRSDNLDAPRPYALYARFRPWRERAFAVQAGRVPPVFGAFLRRQYEYDNPLIGYPLPYQYPTVLRPDSAPASLDQLLLYRGYGARVRYPIGDTSVAPGLAQVNPLRWDTGVTVSLGSEPVAFAIAFTQGTISYPRVDDDNGGKQLAARLGLRPTFGFELGVSASRGDYVSEEVKEQLDEDLSSDQTALGIDAEIARGPWILRGEAIWCTWDVPSLTSGALATFGFTAEGRYKAAPGLYFAARVSGSRFESISTPAGSVTWDSPVTRFEGGVGYTFHRNVLGKAALQYNTRDATRFETRWIPAVQILFWF